MTLELAELAADHGPSLMSAATNRTTNDSINRLSPEARCATHSRELGYANATLNKD